MKIGLKALAKYSRVKEADILEDTYNQFRQAFDLVPYVSRNGIHSLLNTLGEKDAKIRQMKYEDIADMRFVTELERDGFFKDLAR